MPNERPHHLNIPPHQRFRIEKLAADNPTHVQLLASAQYRRAAELVMDDCVTKFRGQHIRMIEIHEAVSPETNPIVQPAGGLIKQ